jgi:hypothetical protein
MMSKFVKWLLTSGLLLSACSSAEAQTEVNADFYNGDYAQVYNVVANHYNTSLFYLANHPSFLKQVVNVCQSSTFNNSHSDEVNDRISALCDNLAMAAAQGVISLK